MMQKKSIEVRSSKKNGYVISLEGEELQIPSGWELLPPGDAALSRRIKNDGPSWTIKEPKGRKLFSRGILAPAERIEALRNQLIIERADPKHQKKLDADRKRRAIKELEYKAIFQQELFNFLNFHSHFSDLAADLVQRITEHAIPVGSNTVARTKTIPLEERVEAATIAWMRHQTSLYDSMKIARIKGERRQVRKKINQQSRNILEKYRQPDETHLDNCPLYKALNS